MGQFGAYLMRRVIASIITMLLIVTLAFAVIRVAPGDPAEIWLADYATPDLVEATRRKMGLDRPVWEQYTRFLGQIATGDLGASLRTGRPVAATILDQYPHTLRLAAVALVVAVVFGVVAGTISALRHNSALDLLTVLGSITWLSIPSFWFGLLLLWFFSVRVGWFPVTGAGSPGEPLEILHALVLPAIALGARQAAVIARMSRSAMLDVLGADFIRTARAKGLRDRTVIYRHGLRNAMVPVLSLTGIEAIILIGGSVVIEDVFSRPGVGRLLVIAVSQRDYAMVQGCIFFFAAAVIVINLLTDLGYAILDPRVKLG